MMTRSVAEHSRVSFADEPLILVDDLDNDVGHLDKWQSAVAAAVGAETALAAVLVQQLLQSPAAWRVDAQSGGAKTARRAWTERSVSGVSVQIQVPRRLREHRLRT